LPGIVTNETLRENQVQNGTQLTFSGTIYSFLSVSLNEITGLNPVHGRFLRLDSFCCKTAQISETPRKSVCLGLALKNRLPNIAKTCAKKSLDN
jgi:hypothetical protein